jgi:hypothetical protein
VSTSWSATQELPDLVVTVDPDKDRTALCWCSRLSGSNVFVVGGMLGGGRGERVPWTTITGAMAWLVRLMEETGVPPSRCMLAVETQAPKGPRSFDVEPLRRVRYHFDAACELLGIECEHVDKSTWQTFFVDDPTLRGEGAIKAAYQRQAKAECRHATNEDRCAAYGIAAWLIRSRLRAELRIDA